jgi:predicted amidohydrolase YtcJ
MQQQDDLPLIRLETRTNEHSKVDLTSAIIAVTRGTAYSMWTEQRMGTIEVGKQVDLVIADLD